MAGGAVYQKKERDMYHQIADVPTNIMYQNNCEIAPLDSIFINFLRFVGPFVKKSGVFGSISDPN